MAVWDLVLGSYEQYALVLIYLQTTVSGEHASTQTTPARAPLYERIVLLKLLKQHKHKPKPQSQKCWQFGLGVFRLLDP